VSAPNSSKTEVGSQLSVNTIAMTATLALPNPGKNEATMASKVPAIGIRMPGHEKTLDMPVRRASREVMRQLPPLVASQRCWPRALFLPLRKLHRQGL
jgi:hypothetical protein